MDSKVPFSLDYLVRWIHLTDERRAGGCADE